MDSLFVKDMIKKNIIDDHINIMGIAKSLGIQITLDEQLTDLATIRTGIENKPVITLRADSDKQTKYTLMVIAMADYILTPKKVKTTGISYDLFFVDDIFAHRQSYQMLLATRLAFPEPIIKQLCNQHLYSGILDYAKFVAESNYLSTFIRSCIDDSAALFLVKNFADLPQNS